MDKMSFGLEIRKMRNDKKMSLRQLGEKTNFTKSYISMIENGKLKSIPQSDTLKKLALGLDVPYIKMLRLAGYFGEETDLTNEDWHALGGALSIEEENEININKIGSSIAEGKVFTLNPDEKLNNQSSKKVSDVMQLSAFLLYHGPEQWGTDPLRKKINEIIESATKESE